MIPAHTYVELKDRLMAAHTIQQLYLTVSAENFPSTLVSQLSAVSLDEF